VNLISPAYAQIEIGKDILLETGSIDKERRIAGGNVVEMICAAGVRNRCLGGARFFVPNRDPGAGNETAGRVLDRALKTSRAPGTGGRWRRTGRVHGGLMGLRREHHGLGQSNHRPARVVGLGNVLDERLRRSRYE
jgi:hypothetical protein